ncbi:Phage integrase [Chromobacterium vaccinii]|nr:Phage integrase [Chromobacterium vaccinii]QND88972.1 Phage integrase [Chromobacterium vaccinii]
MAIKLRGNTWHCDFTAPNGERIRGSLGTSDKKQAQELHDKMKAEAWEVTKLRAIPEKTFDEACLRWLEEKTDKKSLDDDKSRIGFFLLHFQGWPLAEITEEEITRAVSKMENRRHLLNWQKMCNRLMREGKPVPEYEPKPVAVATRATHLAFIRALLNAAHEWKWLETVPKIRTPKAKNKRIRWITKDEAQRLIDVLEDPLKSVVVFALATGLRRSNIVHLEWSQIDMAQKIAWIHPEDAKAGKAIGVALNDTACNILRKQIGKHPRWVFVYTTEATRSNGTRTEKVRKMRVDANKGFKTALRAAGIENFTFHDLRHTWASWLVQAGVPLPVLKEMGGWETLEMVMRYAHLAPSHLSAHAKQIDIILNSRDTNTAQIEKGLDDIAA